ncbi:MAG: hypothetical protein ACLUVG_19600 [Phocaeicola vulgatus]
MGWINGGFMVVEPGALEYENDTMTWEREPLEAACLPGSNFPAISIMAFGSAWTRCVTRRNWRASWLRAKHGKYWK